MATGNLLALSRIQKTQFSYFLFGFPCPHGVLITTLDWRSDSFCSTAGSTTSQGLAFFPLGLPPAFEHQRAGLLDFYQIMILQGFDKIGNQRGAFRRYFFCTHLMSTLALSST